MGSSYVDFGYKAMGYNTTVAVFNSLKIPALEFAFFDGLASTRTFNDNVQQFDERSLQHSGSYALALTREFGNSDLNDSKEEDRIYFDLLSLVLVNYPNWLAITAPIFTVLLFTGIVALGFRNGYLTIRGIAAGIVGKLTSIICVAVVVGFLSMVIHAVLRRINPTVQGDDLTLLGFAILTVFVVSGVNNWFARKASIQELTIGGQLFWLILMLVSLIEFRDVSYLFVWPLLFSLLPMGFLFVSNRNWIGSPKHFTTVSLCAIPAIILIVPAVYTLYLGVGLPLLIALVILLALLLELLTPHLNYFVSMVTKRWAPIYATGGLAAMVLLGASILTHVYAPKIPKSNSIFYGMNADTGEAVWASADRAPDQWTSQFFSSNVSKGELDKFFPFSRNLLSSPAPARPLPPPVITQVENKEMNGVRTLRLRITSPREAPTIEVHTEKGGDVVSALINGKEFKPRNNSVGFRYLSLPIEGIELILTMNSSKPVAVRVVDYTFGIAKSAGIPIKERSENFMPARGWREDTVAVAKKYIF
jgi:hypothetical protein